MVLVPYAGKYFGRKVAYWGESVADVQIRLQIQEKGGERERKNGF